MKLICIFREISCDIYPLRGHGATPEQFADHIIEGSPQPSEFTAYGETNPLVFNLLQMCFGAPRKWAVTSCAVAREYFHVGRDCLKFAKVSL
ncbi:MAG TPA: hypothetical protein VMB85_17675 [Bryobacteraceae bacterium]|nr:hypothetical protein [Bryobacteraceae bacterium]